MSGAGKNMGQGGGAAFVRKHGNATKFEPREVPVVKIGVKNGNGPLGKGSMSLDMGGACNSLDKQSRDAYNGPNGTHVRRKG